MDELFSPAKPRTPKPPIPPRRKLSRDFPCISAGVLLVIVLGCVLSPLFLRKDPAYMDLYHAAAAPCREFLFGTDTMGRDLFSMIWHGGTLSLTIGFLATALSTAIAILVGSLSGLAPRWLDALIMRLTEIFLSIPGLLLVLLIGALLGRANVFSISLALGLTGWAPVAKVVRTEVRQLRHCEYVLASKAMGGGFFHILRRHLTPNFLSAIMFMVVMNIRGAITAESTLSFMGMGLPLEVISWGSMLSLSEKALSSGAWWMILIPGVFLIATLLCITNLGNYLRKRLNQAQSNL